MIIFKLVKELIIFLVSVLFIYSMFDVQGQNKYVCMYVCKYVLYNFMQVLLFIKKGDMKGKNKLIKVKFVV